jgi:gluconate 2-dehydrogenase gamma chain
LDNSTTRRAFLAQAAASLGVAYLGSLTPGLIAQAHQHAKAMASNAETRDFRFFTPQQAADYEAFASQIIPSDETPGAKEANVVHFSDFALSEIEPQNKKAFIAALDALSVQTKKTVPNARTFAGLTASQQSEVMTAIEKTPEFGILRTYSVIGFLVDPIDGGNKNGIGWKLIGFEDKFYYQAPFGYYDAHSDEVKS